MEYRVIPSCFFGKWCSIASPKALNSGSYAQINIYPLHAAWLLELRGGISCLREYPAFIVRGEAPAERALYHSVLEKILIKVLENRKNYVILLTLGTKFVILFSVSPTDGEYWRYF